MSLDGLSFSNLGLYKVLSPVDANVLAEKTAQAKAEEIITKTEEIEKTDPDAEKEKKEQRSQEEENDDDEIIDEYYSDEELSKTNEDIFKNENKIKHLLACEANSRRLLNVIIFA